MEYIGFCIFFGSGMACLFTANCNSLEFIASAIGMGLCAIAGALQHFKGGK